MKIVKVLPIILVIVSIITLNPNRAQAQAGPGDDRNLGIGGMIGEPTGITLKSWNNDLSAFAIGVASSVFTDDADVHALVDYQMHSWLGEGSERRTAFYYGLGGRVIFADDPVIGIRLPLGLNFLFSEIPIGLFVEGAPILDITPDVDLQGNALAGARIYF